MVHFKLKIYNKIKKIVIDSTSGSVKINAQLYLPPFEYRNDTLEIISLEEGRIRPKRAGFSDTMFYDHFEKDHLGNIRVVLSDELKTDFYPAASMELANATIEEAFYDNVAETRDNLPSGYPPKTPPGNAKVSRVRGNILLGPTHMELGPGKLLRVMAGDQYSFTVNSWWLNTASPNPSSNPLGLNQLLTAIGGSSMVNSGHFVPGNVQNSGELYSSVSNFLSNQTGYDTTIPKAFVNWIAFDEHFNYVSSNSGFEQVGASNTYNTHTRVNMPIDKNGFLYIYVSNETPNIDVFFDNLQVTHIRGPLLEESHYYPFGLTMAGISSKALAFGDPGNKRKYNGIEVENALGIDEYEAQLRNLDPQVGRWWEIDPKTENQEAWSPYVSNNDNPIKFADPLGMRLKDAVVDFSKGFGIMPRPTIGE